MNKGCLLIGGAVVGFLGLVVVIALVMGVSIVNTEVSLRNAFSAQENVVETTLDTMRKKIMNEYKVTQDFADKFIKVVQMQADGRKGGQGTLVSVKSSTESSSLGISQDMYLRMANSVSGNLSAFKEAQDRLTDIYRQHQTHCMVFPNSLLIGNRTGLVKKPEMISSEVTKEAVKTKKLGDELL